MVKKHNGLWTTLGGVLAVLAVMMILTAYVLLVPSKESRHLEPITTVYAKHGLYGGMYRTLKNPRFYISETGKVEPTQAMGAPLFLDGPADRRVVAWPGYRQIGNLHIDDNGDVSFTPVGKTPTPASPL